MIIRFKLSHIKIALVLSTFTIISYSCKGQEKETTGNFKNETSSQKSDSYQIARYVVKVFEDSNGNLWFGTIENGVAKLNGQTLTYMTTKNGLPSNRVTAIVEDNNKVLWFGTDSGIVKYNNGIFSVLTEKDGLCSNMISNLLIDSKGTLWIGTWNGICFFDGNTFNSLSIPYPEIDTQVNEDTKDWITDIKEDSKGNIWFARDGYGVCKYDGKTFAHYLKSDGLLSNNVTEIEEDVKGNIWLGSRVAEKDNSNPEQKFGTGGVNKLEKGKLMSFPNVAGFNNDDVYEIYSDNSNTIWICTIRNGVYSFDGKAFKNYDVPISIMSMIEDNNGNFWLGGAGGLYRIDTEGNVINVTVNGPWQ